MVRGVCQGWQGAPRLQTSPRELVGTKHDGEPSRPRPGRHGGEPLVLDVALSSRQAWAVPELPDVAAYVEALSERIRGRRLDGFELRSPFVLRTVDPPYRETIGLAVEDVRRLGKRIIIALSGDVYLAIHLMRLGRFRWADAGKKAKNAAGKVLLATWRFESGTLHLVEMGPKKRAAIHVLRGAAALETMRPAGLELEAASFDAFREAMTRSNHTVKRALCDPRIVSGIGNAYSDEILWEARMSPILQTQKMLPEQLRALWEAARTTLHQWTDRLERERAGGFPEHVTAFREEMAAHGRFGKPCRRCGAAIQRIVYADRETNLLCAMSNGRQTARRSGAVATPGQRLAKNDGCAGRAA